MKIGNISSHAYSYISDTRGLMCVSPIQMVRNVFESRRNELVILTSGGISPLIHSALTFLAVKNAEQSQVTLTSLLVPFQKGLVYSYNVNAVYSDQWNTYRNTFAFNAIHDAEWRSQIGIPCGT